MFGVEQGSKSVEEAACKFVARSVCEPSAPDIGEALPTDRLETTYDAARTGAEAKRGVATVQSTTLNWEAMLHRLARPQQMWTRLMNVLLFLLLQVNQQSLVGPEGPTSLLGLRLASASALVRLAPCPGTQLGGAQLGACLG